jgi:hypothetical protein
MRMGGNGSAYTAVFDNARTGKGGKPINPNDPSENPDLAAQLYGGSGAPQRYNERPPPRARPVPNDHGNFLWKQQSFEFAFCFVYFFYELSQLSSYSRVKSCL